MRAVDIKVFLYFSARNSNDGVNIALFSPEAFFKKEPNPDYQTWQAIIRSETIDFVRQHILDKEKYHYNFHQFTPLINAHKSH